MATAELDLIKHQAQRLSLEDRLRLVKFVVDSLIAENHHNRLNGESGASVEPAARKGLIYGKYKNARGRMSTEEDFKIAEWRPTEEELDGP